MLKIEIIGNIGADAEIKEFGGRKYVSFSVAHTEHQKDEQGKRTDQTTWVSVLWYGESSGLLTYLKKGAKVFVRGNLKVKLYNDKNGYVQYSLNLNAAEVQLCGIKGENTTNAGQISGAIAPQTPTQSSSYTSSFGIDYTPEDLPF